MRAVSWAGGVARRSWVGGTCRPLDRPRLDGAGHLEDATVELRSLTGALHEETLDDLRSPRRPCDDRDDKSGSTRLSARHLLGAAEARDAVAHLRDLSAVARDHVAEDRQDSPDESDCREDRNMAARDRRHSALGRLHALADRNALAAQLAQVAADRPTG